MNATELKARVTELKAELRRTEEDLHQAILDEAPVKLGQIYTRKRTRGYGRNAKEIVQRGQVTGSRRRWGETRITLTLFKADGKLGVQTDDILPNNLGYSDWVLEP